MFDKILIANRGEIALRVQRACHEMGIKTVAIHSTADTQAMHVRLCDEAVCVGPPAPRDSYLNKAAIISAALITNSSAIHPGYGFLSENADFAEMVEDHGLVWIGPSSTHIRMMGDKATAKKTARAQGLPCVPGSKSVVPTLKDADNAARAIGYPLLFKASAGGGGRGMRVVNAANELAAAFSAARAEAKSAFGDPDVYMEKRLLRPRHIEIQILADHHGNVIHLGERDCSLQRRHQKILEEAPSPVLTAQQRAEIGDTCVTMVKNIGYRNAGTLEFLYEDGCFFFIEMNTRLQVEHPITEAIANIDLVREQIRIAAGEKLQRTQKDVILKGHAIECRINAEDYKSFRPSPGKVEVFHAPGGPGVRVDSGLFSGADISSFYDSLAAKLIVHDADRAAAVRRLRRALQELVVSGVNTTAPLHSLLVETATFGDGGYHVHWLESYLETLKED